MLRVVSVGAVSRQRIDSCFNCLPCRQHNPVATTLRLFINVACNLGWGASSAADFVLHVEGCYLKSVSVSTGANQRILNTCIKLLRCVTMDGG